MSASEAETRIPLEDAPEEGHVRMLDLDGHRVGLYRVEGAFHALADRCPHRGAPLCSGKVATPIETDGADVTLGQRHSIVRCPWHKWEFEIATGKSLVDARLRVRQYAVRIDGEDVVVSLGRPST